MVNIVGGVRCERASAYMRLKGVSDVYQLSGGIHAYQETFPNGGLFKGKNFVYDPRVAVPYPLGTAKDEVVGKCISCSCPYDDYSCQTRCGKCRVLVLVCITCRSKTDFSPSSVRCFQCQSL